jgi:hypothetical protein
MHAAPKLGVDKTMEATNSPAGIDIVFPIAMNVSGRRDDLERAQKGLFPSLCRYGYPKITNIAHVICPARDLEQISTKLLPEFPQFKFTITTDEEVGRKLGFEQAAFSAVPGWLKQQLIKLAVASQVATEVVLILDADIVAVNDVAASKIRPSALPYQNMGTEKFRGWFEASATALGLQFEMLDRDLIKNAMGVTPEFLSKKVLNGLIVRLRERSGDGSWGPYLMRHFKDYDHTWTEFSLYWVWYAHSKELSVRHVPGKVYRFLEKPSDLRPGLVGTGDIMFLVLQGTMLNLADCEVVYRELTFNEQ